MVSMELLITFLLNFEYSQGWELKDYYNMAHERVPSQQLIS